MGMQHFTTDSAIDFSHSWFKICRLFYFGGIFNFEVSSKIMAQAGWDPQKYSKVSLQKTRVTGMIFSETSLELFVVQTEGETHQPILVALSRMYQVFFFPFN